MFPPQLFRGKEGRGRREGGLWMWKTVNKSAWIPLRISVQRTRIQEGDAVGSSLAKFTAWAKSLGIEREFPCSPSHYHPSFSSFKCFKIKKFPGPSSSHYIVTQLLWFYDWLLYATPFIHEKKRKDDALWFWLHIVWQHSAFKRIL